MRTVRTLAAALLASACIAPAALADDLGVAGHFDVHLRGVVVSPEASIKAEEGGVKLPLSNTTISDSLVPEIDATYYVTDHVGVELIAATTQHSPHATLGTTKLDLGRVWLLPPTLTVKYSFDPTGQLIRPYVGAGVNYTMFYSPHDGALPDMKYGNSAGFALQAGADVPLGSSPYFLNVDVKKIFLVDSVKAVGGVVRAQAVINPWLIGFGVGMRF